MIDQKRFPKLSQIIAKARGEDQDLTTFTLSLPGHGTAIIELKATSDWHSKPSIMRDRHSSDQIKHGLSEILKKIPQTERKAKGLDVQDAFQDAAWRITPLAG